MMQVHSTIMRVIHDATIHKFGQADSLARDVIFALMACHTHPGVEQLIRWLNAIMNTAPLHLITGTRR